MFFEWIPLLVLGFGLGLLHALDADHILAISTLANQKPSVKRTLLFSMNWALGHGGILLLCGALLFGIGVSIPESLVYIAEISVGFLLIGLGLLCLWRFRQEKIELKAHRHGDITHMHWQDSHEHPNNPEVTDQRIIKEKHQPVMVGVLHGLAGSAPAIALVPAVASGQVFLGMSYLIIFSIGTVLSMLAFGLGFAYIQRYLQHYSQRIYRASRYFIAFLAIFTGGFWVYQAL